MILICNNFRARIIHALMSLDTKKRCIDKIHQSTYIIKRLNMTKLSIVLFLLCSNNRKHEMKIMSKISLALTN